MVSCLLGMDGWDMPADLAMADVARLSRKAKPRRGDGLHGAAKARKRGKAKKVNQELQQARCRRRRRSETPQPQHLALLGKLDEGCIRVASDCTGSSAGAMALEQAGIPFYEDFASDLSWHCRHVLRGNFRIGTIFTDVMERCDDSLASLREKLDLYHAGPRANLLVEKGK